jgi:hypothetical protein
VIKEEGSLQMAIETKYALSAILLANNALMRAMLEINQDVRNALTTASIFILQPRNAPVRVKMVFMSHPDLLALHAPSPAISALELQLLAQIALKIANFLSYILKLV